MCPYHLQAPARPRSRRRNRSQSQSLHQCRLRQLQGSSDVAPPLPSLLPPSLLQLAPWQGTLLVLHLGGGLWS